MMYCDVWIQQSLKWEVGVMTVLRIHKWSSNKNPGPYTRLLWPCTKSCLLRCYEGLQVNEKWIIHHTRLWSLLRSLLVGFKRWKQSQENCPGIRVLCPTKWTVSLTKSNYEVLQYLWQQLIDVTEMRSRIHGVSVYLQFLLWFIAGRIYPKA